MKSMLWKELRENFKWAALGFFVLLLAEFFVLSSQRGSSSYNSVTIFNPTFLLVTSLGCSLIGAALGILQILPELRRDQWASLLHRPVPRGVIFFGKAVAGLLLCLTATTLPLLICVGYVNIPGRFASPFVPGLMLPAFSDLFLGPVFYAAALLACLHRGKWYGSRGAIVLSAVAVLILHLSVGWPFLLPLLATAFFLVAAWGAILTNGTVHGRPMVARIALVLILLAGSGTGLLLLGTALQWAPWFKPQTSFEYTDFTVAKDGTVFLQSQKKDGSQALTWPDGKAVTDARYQDDSGNNFLYLYPIAWDVGRTPDFSQYRREAPRVLSCYVQPLDRNYQSKESWFLLVGQKYFIGYDKLSRRCVGIFDSEGFKPPGAVPRPFSLRPIITPFGDQDRIIFYAGPQVYVLETSDRKLTPIFNAGSELVYGGSFFPYLQKKNLGVAVGLGSGVRILNHDGTQHLAIPYHYDVAEYQSIGGTATEDLQRIFIKYEPRWKWDASEEELAKRITYLDELDAQGKVVRTYSHSADNVHKTPPTWSDHFVTMTAPLLPAAASVTYWKLRSRGDYYYSPNIPGSYSYISGPDLIPLLAIAIFLGIVAWLWARRAGFAGGPAWRWALFVFCLGLPGLMTFRMAANWPACVPCPKCGRKRLVNSVRCPSCDAAWPVTPSNGTEIFDVVGGLAGK